MLDNLSNDGHERFESWNVKTIYYSMLHCFLDSELLDSTFKNERLLNVGCMPVVPALGRLGQEYHPTLPVLLFEYY
jgi:hypothetical protein